MYNMVQLAAAERTVFVISNPDGSDAEFVPLKSDTATIESAFQDLATRWAGRNLIGVGVAGVIRGIPIVMLRDEPLDFLLVVRLTAAYARYVEGAADGSPEPQCDGDSVTWCERLYTLADSRTN